MCRAKARLFQVLLWPTGLEFCFAHWWLKEFVDPESGGMLRAGGYYIPRHLCQKQNYTYSGAASLNRKA